MTPRSHAVTISVLLIAATVGLCAGARSRSAPVSGASALWLNSTGRPTEAAREALALLDHAYEDGLDPAAYQNERLQRLAAALGPPSSPEAASDFDRRLTAAMVRYAKDVHAGRVDPRELGYRLDASPDQHDFAAVVTAAVAARRVGALSRDLAPPLMLYRNLRAALARYRALSVEQLEPLPPHPPVRPGDRYPYMAAVVHRLMLVRDLPAGSAADNAQPYSGAVVDGVRQFQRRHGLAADGVLGRDTQAALNVPLAQRLRQLELALERLRWLPDLEDERLVAVNIPMFRLWAWDAHRADGRPSFQTGVIVGRALNTRTPVLVDEMSDIVFRPYWNVPSSILRNEILPALRRHPDYLRRHDMEIVSAPGAPLRVRQRPGPSNALGLIKFVFPNDYDVYMHGTPAPALFGRARRDFSHGCIRIEDPIGLAVWVLSDQPAWSRERIVAAMNSRASLRVALERPVRVVLFYLTAVVTPDDGLVRFADDIYGHDIRLDRRMRGGT
jgi:L,D-transpeptidase YcbB